MAFFLCVLEDAFSGALADIGFASVNNPPHNAYPHYALISAVGYGARYFLVNNAHHPESLIVASFVTSLVIDFMAVALARMAKCPPGTFSFPSLLPMTPDMYTYRTVEALAMYLFMQDEDLFNHYLYLCTSNGFTCVFDILGMMLGATLSIFFLNKISYRATRHVDQI